MTVDLCTRIWSAGVSPWECSSSRAPRDASPEAHEQATQCVDVAVVLGYRSDRLAVDVPAERIAALVNADPHRRLGFAGIDPASPTIHDDLLATAELGLSGITIAPADCASRPTDDRCLMALDWCARRHLPVLVSNPGLGRPDSVLEYARPSLFDDALREIPDLTLIFGDLGHCFAEEALAMMSKHEHAFAEISTVVNKPQTLRRLLIEAHERGAMSKLLFGSGFPVESPERAIARIYGVSGPGAARDGTPVVPREELREMVERDTTALLGIEHDAATINGSQRLRRPVRTLEPAGES